MERLDHLAERAVADPIAAPTAIDQLHHRVERNARRAQKVRMAIGAAVILPLVIVGGLLTRRSPSEVIDAAGPATVEVDTVFGATLAGDGAVWPAEPMPLADLLEIVATEMLSWPTVEWDESGLGESAGGVTGTQPGRPDRRVALQLRTADSGRWQITSFYPSITMQLHDGNLIGFVFDEPADATEVEVFHLDPVDKTQTRTAITEGVVGAAEVMLEAPVTAERAGTFLIVARDAAGEATAVSGLSIGSPDRLTVAIDRLLGASVPASLPDGVATTVGEESRAPIDLDRSAVIAGTGDGFDLYVVPLADDSGVLFVQVSADGASWSSGGAAALEFNRSGHVSAQFDRSEADGHTLVVLPDSIEFSPDLAIQAVADGRIVVLPFTDGPDRFEVIDGVMVLQP